MSRPSGPSLILLVLIGVLLLTLLGMRISYSFAIRHDYGPGIPLSEALRERNEQNVLLDASSIEPWMTFGYVNEVFALPSAYLKEQLRITDARYPRLSLQELARAEATSTASVLSATRAAVARHAAAETP